MLPEDAYFDGGGTHNELMERNGIYAKLIEMQSFD